MLPVGGPLPRLGGGLMDHSLLAEVRKAALAKLAEQERLDKAAAPAPTQVCPELHLLHLLQHSVTCTAWN